MTFEIDVALGPVLWMAALTLLVPLVLGVPFLYKRKQVLKVYVTAVVAIAATLSAGLLVVLHMDHLVTVVDGAIRVTTPMYSHTMDLADIALDQVAVRSALDGEARLRHRMRAIGLPGYQVGWYSTAGGRAFVVATSPPYVYVPASGSGDLIVSLAPDQVEDAVTAIHAAARR